MSKRRFYITTAISYVNGDPHLGFALECVQADVLARHRRLRGERVRFLSGTDDNSLKNVEAAGAVGEPVAEFVNAKAARFAALREPLELSHDDFIRTSIDPRHRPGVERLWRACAASGDLYERYYEGLYCKGCEAFLDPGELVAGLCPEHPPRARTLCGAQLVLSPLSLCRWVARVDLERATSDRARPAAKRGARLHPRWS